LCFDPATREVLVGTRPIAVPRRELALLELLVRRAGRVVQRGHVEAELYGLDVEVTANALDALVSRLRRRLEDEDAGVELRLVRGVGYLLQPC
jgi:two-component system OmpR family response regulator